jgi:hypothetical protein
MSENHRQSRINGSMNSMFYTETNKNI